MEHKKTAPSLGWKCPHKPKFLTCKECTGNFCARCIQLETHYCPGLDKRALTEKENLAKKLVKVVAPRVAAI